MSWGHYARLVATLNYVLKFITDFTGTQRSGLKHGKYALFLQSAYEAFMAWVLYYIALAAVDPFYLAIDTPHLVPSSFSRCQWGLSMHV